MSETVVPNSHDQFRDSSVFLVDTFFEIKVSRGRSSNNDHETSNKKRSGEFKISSSK